MRLPPMLRSNGEVLCRCSHVNTFVQTAVVCASPSSFPACTLHAHCSLRLFLLCPSPPPPPPQHSPFLTTKKLAPSIVRCPTPANRKPVTVSSSPITPTSLPSSSAMMVLECLCACNMIGESCREMMVGGEAKDKRQGEPECPAYNKPSVQTHGIV